MPLFYFYFILLFEVDSIYDFVKPNSLIQEDLLS